MSGCRQDVKVTIIARCEVISLLVKIQGTLRRVDCNYGVSLYDAPSAQRNY
jgi:hypothetical protein